MGATRTAANSRGRLLSELEIERVWLLSRMPKLPIDAEHWEVEQGYLPESPALPTDAADFLEGRLRRIRMPDGRVFYKHTVKRGEGMIREEYERSISDAEFERAWPSTVGRRINKSRYRVRDGTLTWEIDQFRSLPLVMVEVELPDPHTAVVLPMWLASLVEREVTFDPRYRNAALAIDGVPA